LRVPLDFGFYALVGDEDGKNATRVEKRVMDTLRSTSKSLFGKSLQRLERSVSTI